MEGFVLDENQRKSVDSVGRPFFVAGLDSSLVEDMALVSLKCLSRLKSKCDESYARAWKRKLLKQSYKATDDEELKLGPPVMTELVTK